MLESIHKRVSRPQSDLRKYWSVMTFYERFEQIVIIILSFMISVIVVLALWQLIREVVLLLVNGALNPLDHQIFQVIFGMIMTLLIAMEFKHSILTVVHRQSHIVQARAVIIIAQLALARKLIILDFTTVSAEKLAALGFVILMLGLVHYMLKKISLEADAKARVGSK